ncbi:MAG TPA: hypothetical protein VFR09_06605 [Alphaproteobacteria bacterium]|nr:hypothetical protein [Alphaproteobacteria bacterium]
MPKTANIKKLLALYASSPWTCVHQPNKSLIEAYIQRAGNWATIAEVPASPHCNPREVAEFIIRAVNVYERNRGLMSEMAAALDICLETEKLSWAAEHDADVALRRARESGEI